MPNLHLDFYGASIQLESDSATVIDELGRDFEYFRVGPAAMPEKPIRIELRNGRPATSRQAWAWLRAPQYRLMGWSGPRTVVYADGPVAVYDPAAETVSLTCEDSDRLHELSYLAVLSRAGEALDRRGLHRVHALGFTAGGHGGLLLLPSGGGKSTLALALARRAGVGFLSEDTPLATADGRLRAFPVRWALRADADLSGVPERFVRPFRRRRHGLKKLVDVGYFRERISAEAPARWLIVGERSHGRPVLDPVDPSRLWPALFVNMVTGWGIPQMAEYMLRPGAGLPSIAWRRATAARALLKSARCLRLRLGSSPDEAAALLAELAP